MDIVDRTLSKLVGLPCWGVHWAPVAGLSFSFGPPRVSVREPVAVETQRPRVRRLNYYRRVTVKGAWWFWCWSGFWQLRLGDDDRTVSASSPRGHRDEALGFLDGQRLLGAGVDPRDGTTELLFDLGAALRLWRAPDEPHDIWALYRPGGRVLLVRPDGSYSHEQATHDERWRPRH